MSLYEIRYYPPVGKNAAGWRVFWRGNFVYSASTQEQAERWVRTRCTLTIAN